MAYRKKIKIKLQRPVLGRRRDEEDIYRLDTCTVSGHLSWALDQAQWAWALKQGAGVLEYEFVDTECIRLPLTVEIAGVTPYVRNFRDKKGKLCEQQFEAVRTSSTIEIPVTVLDNEESSTYRGEPPTPGQLTAIFGVIGDSIGISPFGSKFGYGRFEVLEDDEAGVDAKAEDRQDRRIGLKLPEGVSSVTFEVDVQTGPDGGVVALNLEKMDKNGEWIDNDTVTYKRFDAPADVDDYAAYTNILRKVADGLNELFNTGDEEK